jgi:hypothetical protein
VIEVISPQFLHGVEQMLHMPIRGGWQQLKLFLAPNIGFGLGGVLTCDLVYN